MDADPSIRWSSLDGEGFEGLITMHGVLCAFLLSVAIQLQGATSYENQGRATFLGALAYHQDFRTFVHTVLNETKPEYRWNVPVSNGVTVDLEYELLTGIYQRLGTKSAPTSSGCRLNCLERDQGLATVVSYVYPDFPPKYTEGYLIHNPTHYKATTTSSYFAAAGSALLFSGLISNVVIYIAFVLSSPKEDKRAASEFKTKVLPVVFFAYAQLLGAIYSMGYAKSYSATHNSPFAMTDWYIHESFYVFMSFVPALGVTLPAVIFAVVKSSCINPVVKIKEDRNNSNDGEDKETIQIMNNFGSKQLLEALRKQNEFFAKHS